MKFSDIPGHDEAKQRLRAMADSGRLPHALLIEGPTGTGKMALARAFVQYVHCPNHTPDGEPCGVCPSCRQHQALQHIDTQIVLPVVKKDGAATPPVADDFIDQERTYLNANLFVDPATWTATFTKKNARPTHYVTQSSELIRSLSLTANASRYKAVIFWQPEVMQPAAANKLLKLIEEPLPGSMFVMVSEKASDILPTIYSRLQRVSLRRLPDAVVAAHLESVHGLPREEAEALAHIAEGSITAADALVDSRGARNDCLERFMALMRFAYTRNVGELRRWADKLAEAGRDREIQFYDYAIRMMRENFVYNLNVPSITYLNTAEQQFSSRFARFITHNNVERLICHFQRAIADIDANANGKMVNFDVALKAILLIKNA